MARGRLIVLSGLLLVACTKPVPRTTEELGAAITAYEHGEAGVTDARIDALFARLDADIAALRAEELAEPEDARSEFSAQRAALEGERRGLQEAYLKARVTRLGTAARKTIDALSDQVGRTLEDAGRSLREAAQGETQQ